MVLDPRQRVAGARSRLRALARAGKFRRRRTAEDEPECVKLAPRVLAALLRHGARSPAWRGMAPPRDHVRGSRPPRGCCRPGDAHLLDLARRRDGPTPP